jgi:hypothetical protein
MTSSCSDLGDDSLDYVLLRLPSIRPCGDVPTLGVWWRPFSAWNFEFPTKTELLLWKIAGFDIMTTVPVLLPGAVISLLFLVPIV